MDFFGFDLVQLSQLVTGAGVAIFGAVKAVGAIVAFFMRRK